jgi:hypothetical protein
MPVEEEIWDQLMKERHNLRLNSCQGGMLKHVIEMDEEFVALIRQGTSAFNV